MPRLTFLRLVFALLFLTSLFAGESKAKLAMPASLPGEWRSVGRVTIQTNSESAVVYGGYIATKQVWGDAEMTIRMRAPLGTEQVQLWGGFRCRDRDSRYVFALRGGGNNDIYIARYAPDGGARFLGFAPLDFKPVPGVWYRLRVVMVGSRFQIYLNDEKLPRINVVDADAAWEKGGVLLGGGWLPAEYAGLQVKPLTSEEKAALLAVGDKTWTAPALDKEAIRRSQRAAYKPVEVVGFNPQRTEISLDGNWLFMPDYQLVPGEQPLSQQYDDSHWHVMKVPEFWTPGLSWLHGETGFPNLKGVAVTKGVADGLYVQETRRVESYTFDWRKTKAAWYRNYIELPQDLQGRRFELSFDAVAKVSEVWVNGIKVGMHTGMFGPVNCDATKALKPGRNVVAVHVVSEADTQVAGGDKVEGVAVTVAVTSKMLHSLPHGMLQDDVGGIWQPVRLTATSPILVNDSFIQPGLHGADIDLDILNSTSQAAKVALDYSIISVQDGTVLYVNDTLQSMELAANETNHLRLTTPRLNPKLWSPQEPNLYKLEVHLKNGGQLLDTYTARFGFRTFTTDGSRFLLNGKPYWLRGANPFPNTLRPNDAQVARRFMQIARDGNVRVTRSHIVPFTSTWLDAADETGMAVSFEGTWPWLMLEGDPPGKHLLKAWKDEFLSLIREYRNHPSIILWTVNNEMKFPVMDADNPDRLKKKWIILDDMIKAMRATDSTRPIVADSSYDRKEAAKSYRTVVKPNHFDDGDVDDAHRYYGWYNESFFHFYDGQFGRQLATPGRPLISQEMSTGYPRSDDGHPTRFYLFKHYNPQALVGGDAYENADPNIFLTRQAFMTKELAETFRRTSHEDTAGILYFSYFTWFKKAWAIDGMQPWPAYYALKTALQPVLASAELYGRHFYAGATIQRRVCIINDAENYQAIPAGKLQWEFCAEGKVLSRGETEVAPVNYYSNRWLDVRFALPQTLPAPRVDAQLVLKLVSAGKILSENNYDVVIATDDWAKRSANQPGKIILIDPRGQASRALAGISTEAATSLDSIGTDNLVIIGDAENFLSQSSGADKLKAFISRGGRALLLNPKSALVKTFPAEVKKYVAKDGEIVTLHVPESPVFSGIEPLDLAWFERGERRLPIACTGVYQVDATRQDLTRLAEQCDIHAYLKKTSEIAKYNGTPLVEIRIGTGRLIASEMDFSTSENDPIARRLLSNIICSLK